MKNYIIVLAAALIVGLLTGCKKNEDTLTPSGLTETYSLPQGNNSFDQQIVSYYQKYGTYMLYLFTDKDAYWSPTKNYKPVSNNGFIASPGVEVTPAITDYIGAQLALIQEQWFNYYTDTFLRRFLPTKILLCSKVDSAYSTFTFTPSGVVYNKAIKPVPAYYTYDNIKVNFGNANVNTMTATDRKSFMARVNMVFIQSIIGRLKSIPPATFATSADYSTVMTTQAAAYTRGIICPYATATPQNDWNAFMLAMVSFSESELNTSVANTDVTARGILNPTKDTSGKIRQRYNVIRNFFINTFQVDLQKIGNTAKG